MEVRTITTMEELMAELENTNGGICGLRGITEHDLETIANGCEYLDYSLDGSDEAEEGTYLSGTCAYAVSEYMSEEQIAKIYNQAKETANWNDTDTVYLVCGKNYEYGNDDNEVIINNDLMWDEQGAKIVAKVQL